MADPPRYAERMFPEPRDPGIARPDRAVCTVLSGVDTAASGTWGNDERWYHGSGKVGEKAVESIVVYPPTRGVQSQGDAFEPARLGVLIDMELGKLLADTIDPYILAIEDAMNEGVYDRGPVELYTVDARGLPRENHLKLVKGYQRLVDHGCCLVLGPMIADNSELLAPVIDAARVPAITWTGSVRYFGEYCFNIANGGIPEESVICANWVRQQGHQRVGFVWERGSSGPDYADYFRRTAQRLGLTLTKEVCVSPNPRFLEEGLREMQQLGTEALVYVGYGYAAFHFGPILARLGWDPPRIMGTAFMFYSNRDEWAAGIEGWHGIDQLGEDGANPNYEAMTKRFLARFGRKAGNVVVALAYDTARAAMEALGNARIPTPRHVKEGLEAIKWMPAANGGPATNVTFGPYDHRGYKGDYLTIRELRDGKLAFKGYYRPEWASNFEPPRTREA